MLSARVEAELDHRRMRAPLAAVGEQLEHLRVDVGAVGEHLVERGRVSSPRCGRGCCGPTCW
jgi:hypothetical protein